MHSAFVDALRWRMWLLLAGLLIIQQTDAWQHRHVPNGHRKIGRGASKGAVQELPYKVGVTPLGRLDRPRVYMYPVPDQFHEGLLAHFKPGDAGLLSDAAIAADAASQGDAKVALAWTNSEIGIQRCLADSQQRVLHPEDADLYYVPFYPSMCHASQMAPNLFNNSAAMMDACVELGDILDDFMAVGKGGSVKLFASSISERQQLQLSNVGLAELPRLWSRAQGRDHILPGWLPSYTPYVKEDTMSNGPVRLLGDFGVISEPWSQVNDSDYMQRFGYAQAKDLLFPWHLLRDPAEAFAPPLEQKRTSFIYYAGSTSTLIAAANKDRAVLAKLVQQQTDSLFVEMAARFPPTDFLEKMRNSVFCPAPPGDTQLATRHYDAIVAGCIPVVLTEGRVPLPYDNVLDWSKFAVLLPVSSVHDGSFLSTLRSKSNSQIAELRRQVYAVRPYFMISPNCSSPSAVDMLLHQLAMQHVEVEAAKKLTTPASFPKLWGWHGCWDVSAWFLGMACICFVGIVAVSSALLTGK